ncbi:MAG: apolipoprotein N-acyltransferase [Alphaproteobacteria bacterium]|nr:MAG: apolipoprotein N-acyltransferase [Alphaproteobacteria bacterium]
MSAINAWIGRLPFLKRALLAFLLGALVALALAPVYMMFLLPVSFTGLVWIMAAAKTRKQAFFTGWWFAWGQFIAGLYWIGVAFTVDAATHEWLMPLPVLALPAFLAIFSGFACLFTWMSRAEGLARLLIFAAIWTAGEYIRGIIFTGFPWNLVGYVWGANLPVLQSVAYIGIYGLTLITVFVSCLPALIGETGGSARTARYALLLGCSLFAALVGLGAYRLTAPAPGIYEKTNLRLVQPNIAQTDKWKQDLRVGHVRKILQLSLTPATQKPDYLIWPETAVPFYLTTSESLRNELADFVPKGGAIITGAPRYSPVTRQYWNSLQALDEKGRITAIYDKQHLVPYGEYMPLRSLMTMTGLTHLIPALDQMSDFASPDKTAPRIVKIGNLPPARAMICYEIAFPWEVATGRPFDWILNITNDGWFGNTSGPYQHLAMARTRAIEQGVAVVRAANTGISAIIGPYGRFEKRLGLDMSGVVDGALPRPLPGRTLYARFGEYIPVGLTLFFLAAGALLSKQRRRRRLRLSA